MYSLVVKELGEETTDFSFKCDGCGGKSGDMDEKWEWKWISEIIGKGYFRMLCPDCVLKMQGLDN